VTVLRAAVTLALIGLGGCGGQASSAALPEAWTEPTTGMEFVLIRPGTFDMGLRAGEPPDFRAAPLHAVTLTEPFYLGRYEVTQKEWFDVMGDPTRASSPGVGTIAPWRPCPGRTLGNSSVGSGP
jgi:formylglycine-generating enzyme required for sulfatase activity